MTSKLTREENVQAVFDLKAGYTLGLADVEILKRVARMALAAMDSEAKEPISFDEWSRKCALQITLCHPDFREKAQYIWDSARATHQPAPVVPEDVLDALQKVARIRLDLNDFDGDRRGIADCLCDAEEALIEVVTRRAAMLQELQKSAGAANNCRSNKNVQDLQDESRCGIKSEPPLDFLPKNTESRCSNSPVIPEGYVMVPKEPTPEILAVITEAIKSMRGSAATYARVLAAAPQPQSAPQNIPEIIPGWIPVSERMPGSQEWVIVFAKWANQQVLCWDDVQNRWTDFEDQSYYADMFTHWMSLPAGPKEEK